MAAGGDIAQRLARMANMHPDQGKREEAAQAYRELTGQDPPVNEGPMPEGQPRMGAPSALANQKRAPIADPAEAVQPSMLGRAAGAVKDFVTGPLNAAAAGFNDRISMGMYPAALDLVGASSPQYRQKLATEHPIADTVGQGTGIAASALVPGAPAAIIDRGLATTAEGLAPQLMKTAGGQIGRGVASGALTGGTENVARNGGGTAEGMAKAFEEGAAPGAVVGGAFAGAGELAKAGAAGIRAVSPRIRDFVSAKEGGAYQSPELQGLAHGSPGVRQAAENAGDAILARDRQMSDRDYRNSEADLAPFMKSNKIDTGKAQGDLLSKYMDNLHADTGEPKDMALAKALEDEAVKLGDVKTLKGMLDNLAMSREKANFGSTAPTPENQAYRQVYEAQNKGLGGVVPPEVEAARSESRKSLEAERRRHDIIANTEGQISRGRDSAGDENVRVTKEKQIATLLERVGDDTKPGRDAKRYLDELAAQDPEIARLIEVVRAKKAQEATRFSTKPLVPLDLAGTNEAAGYGPAFRQNSRAIAGQLVEPALRVGGQNAAAAGARMAPGLAGPLRDPIDALLGRKKKRK